MYGPVAWSNISGGRDSEPYPNIMGSPGILILFISGSK